MALSFLRWLICISTFALLDPNRIISVDVISPFLFWFVDITDQLLLFALLNINPFFKKISGFSVIGT